MSNKPSQCTNVDCQSFSIIEEHGQQVCQECGAVCQELEIVNDNAFGEGRDGQLTMIGSQVGNDKTRGRPFGSGLIKGIGAFESQEIAERKGNAHDRELKSLADLKGQLALNRIASALNMSQSLRAPAMRLYRIAMGHNFIQGRSVDRVAAVCLYVASRVQTGDGQKYMLIDFADNLKASGPINFCFITDKVNRSMSSTLVMSTRTLLTNSV